MRYLFFFMIIAATHTAFASQERIALVIGNADYADAPLKNPVNDAESMSKVLGKMGFKIIKGENLSRKQMRVKIREFGKALKSADVGLFYFAGHGMQYKGQNYLIPVKANIESADEIIDEAINASSVLRKMENAGNSINIMVLDACRNNPFMRSFRSASRGLARIEGPKGTLIAYSTAPGGVAADGDGDNGLYTQYLIQYMQEAIPLEKVFKKVRISVSTETNDKQVPWENSSLVGEDFYFNINDNPRITHPAINKKISKPKKHATEFYEPQRYYAELEKELDSLAESAVELLLISPNNEQAQQIYSKTLNRYYFLALELLKLTKIDRAEAIIDKGLKLSASDHKLNDLKQIIQRQQKDLTDSQIENIRELFDKAEEQIQAGHYVMPKGQNALESYQSILAIEPRNSLAIKEINKILYIFEMKIRVGLNKDAYNANGLLNQALAISPFNEKLHKFQYKIKNIK